MNGNRENGLSVLVPYPGLGDPEAQDIFVYLRPESNGVLVESTMLRVIQHDPEFKRTIFLVYLANLSGEFIIRNHIIEEHYSLKLRFAVHGGKLFTPRMRDAFSQHFSIPFEKAKIVGSFEALRSLSLTPDELFRLWVGDDDFWVVNGQSIKKFDGLFVVNYDIPALLQKNNENTDIAVMIFRTTMKYEAFERIVLAMQQALVEAKILSPGTPLSRVFHYSKSPFEQILDGTGHLFTPEGKHISAENLAFSRFLQERSFDFPTQMNILRNPLFLFRGVDGNLREESIYSYTQDDSYEAAFEKLKSAVAQVLIP